ncbi:P1 family peptidase [Xanthomonas sp. XNM01]|uniref:P1 family peptidase n=1 Tax=Xanthomonas sp. XNM01 TaxID=2769289 RepID=UPI00177F53A3|nr:P1 family peptidase [Xanthomonas sp. XNM01]MBD9369606.1 P1 family peptidase [Xanthomonas sp. XNM01]
MKPAAAILLALACATCCDLHAAERPRAREAGIIVGVLPPGPLNAITDVPGVRVGQSTPPDGLPWSGVTAIHPHEGNAFLSRVPAAIEVGNGFGKLIGLSQVRELGELETPVVLTGTLATWRAADATAGWLLRQPGMEQVRSINPVVGETNDGFLVDIRARALPAEAVESALSDADSGPVAEGAVGAGAGTVAFGWKGGIGTSSRVVEHGAGRHTLGVLVQSNYGGRLTVAGVPVWRTLPDPRGVAASREAAPNTGDGSIMIVVATDAPLDARQLGRLARRALFGLARTGSSMSHGSGDYVIAFSNASALRHGPGEAAPAATLLADEAMTPLFEAVADATEEAILNSMFRARTVRGHRGTVPALPLAPVLDQLRAAGAVATQP